MVTRNASAEWNGALKQGGGKLRFGSFEGEYSFGSRFESGKGTNPEELIGAAHAGCFSMALALVLGKGGFEPKSIRTSARVHFDPNELSIAKIELTTEAEVPGLNAEGFRKSAEEAKQVCPVSKALAGVEIVLKEARLAGRSAA